MYGAAARLTAVAVTSFKTFRRANGTLLDVLLQSSHMIASYKIIGNVSAYLCAIAA
jgi:hypothetical protein